VVENRIRSGLFHLAIIESYRHTMDRGPAFSVGIFTIVLHAFFSCAASDHRHWIAGFAFGRAAAEQQIVGTIEGMIGQQSAEAVQGMIRNASSRPKAGMISAAVGIVTLILGADVVVGQLQPRSHEPNRRRA
jgi:hypothetical protein